MGNKHFLAITSGVVHSPRCTCDSSLPFIVGIVGRLRGVMMWGTSQWCTKKPQLCPLVQRTWWSTTSQENKKVGTLTAGLMVIQSCITKDETTQGRIDEARRRGHSSNNRGEGGGGGEIRHGP